jgi:hypothetical protein
MRALALLTSPDSRFPSDFRLPIPVFLQNQL